MDDKDEKEKDAVQFGLNIRNTPINKMVTPLDKIDAVLNYFYDNKDKEPIWDFRIPKSFLIPKRMDLTTSEIISICSKLTNEGYLQCEYKDFVASTKKFPCYKINFDGELLWLNGSYNDKIKKQEYEKTRINENDKKLLDLQYIIAFVGVASALYYLIDLILKGCPFLVICFLLGTLTTGIILWLIRQQNNK